MSALRLCVFAVLLVALNFALCNAGQGRDFKRPVKIENPKQAAAKDKRDSSELTASYGIKQKDEPFRPLQQYYYPGDISRYSTAVASPQISYSKPEQSIDPTGRSSPGGNGKTIEHTSSSTSNIGGIQYAPSTTYKPQGGIQYSQSAYKSANVPSGGIQYAPSNAYRGPFIESHQSASGPSVKSHSGQIYAASPSPVHPIGAAPSPTPLSLPLQYGGVELPLPHNQYAITFPGEYLRHYHHNLAAPFPLHGTHMMPMYYADAATSAVPVKDQPFKQNPFHYITLAPQTPSGGVLSPPPATSLPSVITQFIPLYGPGSQQHHQSVAAPFYFSGHHQHAPTAFTFNNFPPQHQTFQIGPKHPLLGQIPTGAIGPSASSPLLPMSFSPLKPIVVLPQHQQLHPPQYPISPSFSRYSQTLPGPLSIPTAAGHQSEIPALHPSNSPSVKVYSPSSSSTSPGQTGIGSTSGKEPYIYTSNGNNIGPIYTHPGAMQYGTHLYHPSSKIIEIGSNRATAGSAVIAGVAPSAYHGHSQTHHNPYAHQASAPSITSNGSSSSDGGNSNSAKLP